MIEQVQIKNFKCFKNQKFSFRNLTVLCGQNSGGKSSVIQALLLARQAASFSNEKGLKLNGLFGVHLGTAFDIFYNGAEENQIQFNYQFRNMKEVVQLTLKYDEKNANEQRFMEIIDEPMFPECMSSLRTCGFVYLGAERLGPRDILPTQSQPHDLQDVGPMGEYTAELLASHERKPVREEMCHPDGGDDRRLRRQVELWMRELIPSLSIEPTSLPRTNSMALFFKIGGIESEWRRQGNMGFGVSYSLPIIVAGLLAEPGSVMIIDSPEAHLHPAAQARLTQFLARLAAGGVQVILETHSDHVLNGLRLAALNENPLQREQVIIYHMDYEEGISELTITHTGSLSHWPKGFFDQSERDLAAIVKERRRHGNL